MRLYLAGPLFTAAEIHWNAQLASEFRQQSTAEVLLPQEFCKGMNNTCQIAEKCMIELRSATAVVVNADGADVDSGTAFEAGMACALGIRLIVYRTDFRRAGDSVRNVNLMLGYAGAFLDCQGDSVDIIAYKVLKEYGY